MTILHCYAYTFTIFYYIDLMQVLNILLLQPQVAVVERRHHQNQQNNTTLMYTNKT